VLSLDCSLSELKVIGCKNIRAYTGNLILFQSALFGDKEVINLDNEATRIDEDETSKSDNFVLVGKKPVMNYVTACITFFNSGEKQVIVKARGRAISRAVDTVELLRRAFVKNLAIKNVDISTEEIFRAEGDQKSNVSTIEITVAKAKPKQSEQES
jgi:DNA-binding protein